MSSGSFKNVANRLFLCKSYIFNICMYKQDLSWNNLYGLICHKTQPTIKFKRACHFTITITTTTSIILGL